MNEIRELAQFDFNPNAPLEETHFCVRYDVLIGNEQFWYQTKVTDIKDVKVMEENRTMARESLRGLAEKRGLSLRQATLLTIPDSISHGGYIDA